MPIRVLIADDHVLFCCGLRALLEKEPDIEVVGVAGDFAEMLAALAKNVVDILLMDVGMPGGTSASQAVSLVLSRHSGVRIVVLTMHEDDYYVRELFRLGVHGFVLKKSELVHLLGAVRTAARGNRYVDPTLGAQVVAMLVAPPVPGPSSPVSLTPREQQVCSLLAHGHTNAEIAAMVMISERTVEAHRAKLMSKLELRNRAELVRFAIDNGLLRPT